MRLKNMNNKNVVEIFTNYLYVIILVSIMIFTGCNDMMSKSDDNYYNADDYLIEQIQNATNKVEIDLNELPVDAQVTIEQYYMSEVFLSELLASGLGYELTIADMNVDETDFRRIYFNLEGRKLEHKRDEEREDRQCFDLVYPVTFILPDGSSITVTDREDWEELKDWYEENPDSEERPTLQYPVDIIYEDGITVTINNEDEMDAIKENCE